MFGQLSETIGGWCEKILSSIAIFFGVVFLAAVIVSIFCLPFVILKYLFWG